MSERITKDRLRDEFDGKSFTAQGEVWTLTVVGMYPVQLTFSYTVYFDVSGETRTVRKLAVHVFKWPTWGTDRIINRIAEVFTDGVPPDGHLIFTEPIMNRRRPLMDENIAQRRLSRRLSRGPDAWRIRVKRFERIDAEWYRLWVDLEHPTEPIKDICLICPEKSHPMEVHLFFWAWLKHTNPQDGAQFDMMKFVADWKRRRQQLKPQQ